MSSIGVQYIPAWQTEELQDEWIEQEPGQSDDDDLAYDGTRSISMTVPLSTHIHTNNDIEGEGSPSHTDTSRAIGTFLVREDVDNMPFLPKTPGQHKKGLIKDFFTPLPLERMFDPPSPPIYSSSSGAPTTGPTISPPQSAILRAGVTEEDEGEDDIQETDIPNMKSLNGGRARIGCQFTFSVPRDVASKHHVPSHGGCPQAQSTPNPPAGGNGGSAPATDSRLRLFQFQYDTYTREHLSAMVDSIAINTPSGSRTTVSPPSYGQHLSRVSEVTGSAPNMSHLRSTKRIKLSPPNDYYGEGAGAGAIISRPKLSGKDYVGESRSLMEKIKQARDYSTISTVPSAQATPTSHNESKTHAGHDPLPKKSSSLSDFERRPSYLSIPEQPNSNAASSSSSTNTLKSNSYSSFVYRQNAMTLMEQIKSDMKGQKRIFSGDTDTSHITTQVDDPTNSFSRSVSSSVGHRRKPKPDEKENHGPGPGVKSSHHRRTSSSKSNISRTKHSPKKHPGHHNPEDTSEILANKLLRVSISEHPTSFPPSSTETHTQLRPPTLLVPPSLPSVRAGTNEDLNRFVSSSTASGTTLTASSAPSFVKHAGPAQIRTIAPTDLPPLPERLGDMLFDKVMMKWVKSTAQATKDADKSVASIVSDDPFGDIESLQDDSRGRVERYEPESETREILEVHAGVVEMSAIEERSEAEDEEELELTSFSTDASVHVVDIMTGVDTTGFNDGDETTDSDDNGELDGTITRESVRVIDYESGDEDASPTDDVYSVTNTASQSFTSPPRRSHASVIVTVSTPSRSNGAPSAGTPVIRSALKNQTATPSSVLKNSSRNRYRTPDHRKSHRRSVSFSDGKRDGPIQGLHNSNGIEPYDNGAGTGEAATTQPSIRSKRIADMMEALADSDFEDDESPSKTSSLGRPDEIRPLSSRQRQKLPQQPDTTATAEPRRTFSRSQTYHPSPGKSLAKANGTFLTECSFGVAHDRLVQVITDVQPFEPHWEELSAVDLSNKKLESVARLKEFLPRLDSLCINSNQIAWLSGVPGSVRTLSVASNSLTGLTSFGHLVNLENLDISHNDVDSLRQLECLRHLRELKADGNKITTIDGLQRMDGLVKLSLEGNSIQSVDLGQYRWTRLEMLNISHNRLDNVRGLSSLQSLIAVNLDSNSLKEVEFGSNMARLRILRLSRNRLSQLQVAALPNLRTLYADNNSLSALVKVDRLTKLENLSLRNQGGRGFSFLTRDARDVKRLYLSGNPLKSRFIEEPSYNLVYLELAACRLTALPEGLLKLVPNLRVLNLNYNFLEDVRPLEGLTRLQKLTIIGSRLKSTKPLIRLLQRMPDAEMLDFRMNPCTLGWYLPLLVKDVPGALQLSEGREGTKRKTNCGSMATGQAWQDLDAKFRRDLPDESYVGRLAYRGLIMRACPRIRMLDGVGVSEKERMKAHELLQGILGRGKKEKAGSVGGVGVVGLN